MKPALLALLFVLAVSLDAPAQNTKPVQPAQSEQAAKNSTEQELRALMNLEYEAELNNDFQTLSQLWAEEYISSSPRGLKSSKSQLVAYYRALPQTRNMKGTLMLDDVRVDVYGDVAVMTGRAGTPARGGVFVPALRFTRVHVRRGGKWLLVASHISRIESAPAQKAKTG